MQDGKTGDDIDDLVGIAQAFYVNGQSKVQIAQDRHISRFQVARMLTEAQRRGIVDIRIHDPRLYSTELGAAVAERLGLDRVAVIESLAEPGGLRAALGRAGAELLGERARPDMVIGISWSRTLDAAADDLPILAPATIVQLVGALNSPHEARLLHALAALNLHPGISTWPLYTPLLVDNASTAEDLRRQPEVATALAQSDRLDLAIVAVGAWLEGESTVWSKVDRTARAAATTAGAVAEVSGRLLDADGNPVDTGLDDRTIGVTVKQLIRTPEVIAVASGTARAAAVCAAVKAGVATSLVIDTNLANELLAR
jgi:DNA-binding transcriptional regulator LsrR (DeoR family)